MDPKRIKKYFQTPSWKPGVIPIGIGLLCFAIGGGAIVLGLLLIAGGGAWLYFQFGNPVTDQEIQAEINKLGAAAKGAAMARLGLDAEQVNLIEPVMIEGPVYTGLMKLGKDKIVRSAVNEVVVLFFSETEVHCYKVTRSLVDTSVHREQTDEYFYKDVVAVNTATDSQTIKINEKSIEARLETFKLTTSGGTSITCSAYDGGALANSIQGMRQLIKQRKLL